MTQGIDPLKKLNQETPIQRMMKNAGGNITSSAYAMANHPLVGAAGAVTGLGKGVTDIPMMLGAGAESLYHTVKGDTNYKSVANIEGYDKSWRDNTIKAVNTLTGKDQNTNLDNAEVQKAVASGQAITSMIGPGHIPGLSFLKGGATGIAAEAGLKAADRVDRGINAVGKVASPVLDPLLKGIAQSTPGLKATESGFNASSVVSNEFKLTKDIKIDAPFRETLANTLNPKSVTNSIKASNPGALPALSEKYNFPISNVDDLGQVLYPKFQQFKEAEKNPWGKITKEVDKSKTDKYIDDIINPKKDYITNIHDPANLQKSAAELERISSSTKFKAPTKSTLDTFIDKELSDIDLSPKARALLKDRMTTSILEQKRFHDLDSSKQLYDSHINQALESRKIAGRLEELSSKPNLSPKELEEKNILLDNSPTDADYDKVLDSARTLRTNFDNHYKDALFSGDEAAIKKANDLRMEHDLKVQDQLNSIKKGLGDSYNESATDSMIGNIGKYSNVFKIEPVIGDLTQVSEAFPSAARNNADLLGVDYEHAIAQQKGYSNWQKSNQELVKSTLIDKYKNSIQALKDEEEIAQASKAGSIGKKLSNMFDNIGYSFQNQNKERIIENVILPKAYGQIKAWGKFEEGTKEFNRAVINHATKFIQDVGMAPPKVSYVTKTGESTYQVNKHYDEAIKEMADSSQLPPFLKKEIKAGSLMMSTWVKGAAQAKLQAYNGIVESFREIASTGKVTDAQRARILSGVSSIAYSTALFGVRGVRVPGLFQEDPLSAASNPQAVPETLGTHLVDVVQKLVGGMTNKERELLREGAWGHFTGLSGARTESVPFIGAGTGNSITASLIQTKFKNLTDGISRAMANWSNGKLGAEDLIRDGLQIILPNDIDVISDAQLYGGRLDSKGNMIAPDPSKHPLNQTSLGQQLGAISKNLDIESTSDNPNFLGTEITTADNKIAQKYDRYNIKQFLKDGHIKEAFKEYEVVYQDNPELALEKITKLVDDKLAPERSKLFKEIKSNSKDLLAIDKNTLIKEYPKLSRLGRDQALDLAAESIAMDKNLETLTLIKKVGRLKRLTDDEIKYIVAKAQEIENQKVAIFGEEEEEDNTPQIEEE